MPLGRGSPPRVRGKDGGWGRRDRPPGITPARAGKRSSSGKNTLSGRDHPRACGEKSGNKDNAATEWGSPPRVRGKGPFLRGPAEQIGITPARAGKSLCRVGSIPCGRDHPRACGEKLLTISTDLALLGSPPRVRGKEPVAAQDVAHLGITPARAGKSIPFA